MMHDDDYEDDTDTDACPECGCTVRSMEELAIREGYLAKIEEFYGEAVVEARRGQTKANHVAESFRVRMLDARKVRDLLLDVAREEAE